MCRGKRSVVGKYHTHSNDRLKPTTHKILNFGRKTQPNEKWKRNLVGFYRKRNPKSQKKKKSEKTGISPFLKIIRAQPTWLIG